MKESEREKERRNKNEERNARRNGDTHKKKGMNEDRIETEMKKGNR